MIFSKYLSAPCVKDQILSIKCRSNKFCNIAPKYFWLSMNKKTQHTFNEMSLQNIFSAILLQNIFNEMSGQLYLCNIASKYFQWNFGPNISLQYYQNRNQKSEYEIISESRWHQPLGDLWISCQWLVSNLSWYVNLVWKCST